MTRGMKQERTRLEVILIVAIAYSWTRPEGIWTPSQSNRRRRRNASRRAETIARRAIPLTSTAGSHGHALLDHGRACSPSRSFLLRDDARYSAVNLGPLRCVRAGDSRRPADAPDQQGRSSHTTARLGPGNIPGPSRLEFVRAGCPQVHSP
jgi:hypothetical protein